MYAIHYIVASTHSPIYHLSPLLLLPLSSSFPSPRSAPFLPLTAPETSEVEDKENIPEAKKPREEEESVQQLSSPSHKPVVKQGSIQLAYYSAEPEGVCVCVCLCMHVCV